MAARYQVVACARLFIPQAVETCSGKKEFTSFQLLDNNVTASPTMETATCGSFHPLPAELALKSPCT